MPYRQVQSVMLLQAAQLATQKCPKWIIRLQQQVQQAHHYFQKIQLLMRRYSYENRNHSKDDTPQQSRPKALFTNVLRKRRISVKNNEEEVVVCLRCISAGLNRFYSDSDIFFRNNLPQMASCLSITFL